MPADVMELTIVEDWKNSKRKKWGEMGMSPKKPSYQPFPINDSGHVWVGYFIVIYLWNSPGSRPTVIGKCTRCKSCK